MSRTISRWLAAACLLSAATATAQDEPGDPDEVVLPQVAVPAPPEFDVAHWIYGGRSVEETKKGFESALDQGIGRFDRKYGLTPAQRKKLQLAGRHDIRRFFDRVDGLSAEVRRANGNWHAAAGTPIDDLRRTVRSPHSNLFGDGSMLAKTMRKNVTAEQVAGHEKSEYRKKVEWMAEVLHGRLVLGDDQRRRLVELVVEETPPLKHHGNHDYDAIMFQMSRLPREKLRAFLDDNQYRALGLRFEQARRLEGVLVSEGYLARSKPAAGSPVEGPLSQHEESRR